MKLQLTDQNHFKFGYNNRFFNFREKSTDQWCVSYGRCHREPLSFKEECIETAKKIETATKLPIWLLFSGGADSEVVLRSFLMAKVAFKIAIMRFKFDLNLHDISIAVKICEQLGLKYYFFDLDLMDFWHTSLLDYTEPTYCITPLLAPHMWLIDQLDGYPVLGSGECLLVKDRPHDYTPGVSPYEVSQWQLFEKEKIAAWYRHLMHRNREGCAGFFQYTPEILLSYLRDPFVENLTSCKIIGKLSSVSSKLKIYQQYFDIENKEKYHGFEQVNESKFREALLLLNPHADEIAKTPVTKLIRQLSF